MLDHYHGDENTEWLSWMREALNLDDSILIFDERLKFEHQFFAELERVQRGGISAEKCAAAPTHARQF